MPIYLYEHPKTKEVREVIQRMNEKHVYSENGIEWVRVFISPNATIDSFNNLNPFDKDAFVKRTAKTGMKIGDMWDESKKMSQRRADSVGKDFVRVNAENDYKQRTGKDHPEAEKPKPKYLDVN